MPAHRKPDGSHIDKLGAERRRVPSLSLPSSGNRDAYPPPPDDLPDSIADAYCDLWESPQAVAWLRSEASLVLELVELRSLCSKLRRSGEIPPGVAMSRMGFLEDRLLLSARARAAAGAKVVDDGYDDEEGPW